MKTFIYEFWRFGLKQAWACLFGGALLGLMILTSFVDWEVLPIARNDALFIGAILIQLGMLVFKLETKAEMGVIILFHLVATGMEIFKTSDAIASWQYPGEGIFYIGNYPLFAGFMYSAVGSYLARVWREFDFRFTHYPSIIATTFVSGLVYVNFFTHHFFYDLRYLLLITILWLYRDTWIYFKIDKTHRRMSLLIGFLLVALFIWLAENIGTFTQVWLYPNQLDGWALVTPDKILAWFLLMILSFVMVSWVRRPKSY